MADFKSPASFAQRNVSRGSSCNFKMGSKEKKMSTAQRLNREALLRLY